MFIKIGNNGTKIIKFKYALDTVVYMELDNKDWKILEQLKENSRMPIRDVAKKTGVRPSTVHQRILKLKENRTIEKFTLKLDNKAVGENFIVFMLVKTKPSTVFGNKIVNDNHVKEIFGVTGEYDLMMKLKFKDVEQFNNYVIKFRKEQNIESTLTLVATANIKEEM